MTSVSPEINESSLEGLSPEQIGFAGRFLKLVFAENARDLTVASSEEKQVVVVLLGAFSAPNARGQVFSALSVELQREWVAGISDIELVGLVGALDDLWVLGQVFDDLSVERRGVLLKHLYRENRELYRFFKKQETSMTEMMGGVLVKRSQVPEAVLVKETDQILAGLISTKTSLAQSVVAAQRLSAHYELDELDKILTGLVAGFGTLDIPMKDEASFFIHLKFYAFVDVFFAAFPELGQQLSGLLGRVISALSRLPSAVWRVTVLSQFPESVIRLLLLKLRGYEQIRDFEKRTLYTRLLQDIKKHIGLEQARRVRTVMEGL